MAFDHRFCAAVFFAGAHVCVMAAFVAIVWIYHNISFYVECGERPSRANRLGIALGSGGARVLFSLLLLKVSTPVAS